MWDIVWVSPQGHRSVAASRYFFLTSHHITSHHRSYSGQSYRLKIDLIVKKYVPVQILEIIENLFSGCCTCIKFGNSFSTEFQIEFGVRQGSVLSPFLFAIYVDNLCALCKPGSNLYITRSHGSVTSVVRATRQVNGRRQTYPSHHTHTH